MVHYTFLVEPTMTDTIPTLTKSPCIEVSINSNCNESADSFQAQLQYTEKMCGIDQVETDRYALNEDYRVCIPISAMGNVCYSALVFHNNVIVGIKEAQNLILLPCNISSLNSVPGVVINSTMGEIAQGDEVPHNALFEFQCELGYSFVDAENNQTRCVNGTFEPSEQILGTLCSSSKGVCVHVCVYVCMHVHASVRACVCVMQISHTCRQALFYCPSVLLISISKCYI